MLTTFDFTYANNYSFNEFVEKIGKYYSMGGCNYRSYCNDAIVALAIHATITHDDKYLARLVKAYKHNASFSTNYRIPQHSDYKFKKDMLKTVSPSAFAYAYIASTLSLDTDVIIEKCLNGEYSVSMFDCDPTETINLGGSMAQDDVKNLIWVDLLSYYGFNIVQTLFMAYSMYELKYDSIGVVNSREFDEFKSHVLDMANSLRKLDEQTLLDYSRLVAEVYSTTCENPNKEYRESEAFSSINPLISQLLMNNVRSMVTKHTNISMLSSLPVSMWLTGVNSSISPELFALAGEYFAACSRIMSNHVKIAVNSAHDLYERDFLTTSMVEYDGYYNNYNWNSPNMANSRVQAVMWTTVRMVKSIKKSDIEELDLISRNSMIKHFELLLLNSRLTTSMLDRLSGKVLCWLIKYYIIIVWSTILQYDVNSVEVFRRAHHAGKLKLNIILNKLNNNVHNKNKWEAIITRCSEDLQNTVNKQFNDGWLSMGVLDGKLCDGLEVLRKSNKTVYDNVTERLYID